MNKVDRNAVAALREELALLESQILDLSSEDGVVGSLKARHRGLLATLHDVRRAEDRRVRALVSRLIVAGGRRSRPSVRRLEIPLR